MKEAPSEIDGALLLYVADVAGRKPTGGTTHRVHGKEVREFAALAIARYKTEPGVYLLYCDDDWNALTDTYHETVESAVAQGTFEFGEIDFAPVEESRTR